MSIKTKQLKILNIKYCNFSCESLKCWIYNKKYLLKVIEDRPDCAGLYLLKI